MGCAHGRPPSPGPTLLVNKAGVRQAKPDSSWEAELAKVGRDLKEKLKDWAKPGMIRVSLYKPMAESIPYTWLV